jgi:hypothetical protein
VGTVTQFAAGMHGDIGGVQWRVVEGKKSINDLRLDVYIPRWVPPQMSVGFLFADFYAFNERRLSRDGYLARAVADAPGARYLHFLGAAMQEWIGWEGAAEQLRLEREFKKRARDAA